jgi:hypothetical protein
VDEAILASRNGRIDNNFFHMFPQQHSRAKALFLRFLRLLGVHALKRIFQDNRDLLTGSADRTIRFVDRTGLPLPAIVTTGLLFRHTYTSTLRVTIPVIDIDSLHQPDLEPGTA